MARPIIIKRFPAIAVAALAASACSLYNDPTREGITNPSEEEAVEVLKYLASDPLTGEVYGEGCFSPSSGANFELGMGATASLPLEQEYQLDVHTGNVSGATPKDHSHSYFCALTDLSPLWPHEPTCTFSEKPEAHELVSFDVFDADGTLAGRDDRGYLEYAGPGGFERYRLVSHEYGLIRIKTSNFPCSAQRGPTDTYDLLTIEPPESSP
jgi:hypothetical protein